MDQRFPDYEKLKGWIIIGFLAIPGLVGSILAVFLVHSLAFRLGLPIIAAFILISLSAVNVWLPHRSYRARSWRLTDRVFQIRHGIWWRKIVAIPRTRVQHADVEQGPLRRFYGLATLVIHTAGTHNPSIGLEGLNYSVAIKIRDALIENRKLDDGV